MLVKTNKKNKNGKNIYVNALTGEEGVLNSLNIHPSSRKEKRHLPNNINKVRTNRKSTRGRVISYQTIVTAGSVKTIKHIQDSPKNTARKIAHFETLNRIELNKRKWHKANPEYKKKQARIISQ